MAPQPHVCTCQTAHSVSSPGLTGRSSIPEAAVLEPSGLRNTGCPRMRGADGKRASPTKCSISPSRCWPNCLRRSENGRWKGFEAPVSSSAFFSLPLAGREGRSKAKARVGVSMRTKSLRLVVRLKPPPRCSLHSHRPRERALLASAPARGRDKEKPRGRIRRENLRAKKSAMARGCHRTRGRDVRGY